MFDDMGLGEGAAKRFAGEAHLFGRILDQLAFAGGHQVDGAPHLGGDAELLVDRFGGRAGFDGGERAGCGCFCHPRTGRVFAVSGNVLNITSCCSARGVYFGDASGRV